MIVFRPLNGNLLSVLDWTCPPRFSLDRISNVHVTLFLMTFLGIIWRLVKLSQQSLRFTIGLFINWRSFLTPWVTGSNFIKLRLQRARNVVTSRSKTTSLCKNLKLKITVYLLLVHWYWITPWPILGLGAHICTLWTNLRTQDVQMVFLTHMGH